MEIPKPTDADGERFRALAPDEPDVEIKPWIAMAHAAAAALPPKKTKTKAKKGAKR
jgi:hypothetical protein